jgi:DNA-3-methyladenine glycosylase II
VPPLVVTTLPVPQPTNVDLTIARLRLSSYGAPCRFVAPRTVRRLLHVPSGPALVEFRFNATTLTISVLAGEAIPEADLQATALMWGFAADLAACEAALAADPVISPLVLHYHGQRLVSDPDLYEALVVAILGQQISVRAAHAIRTRLMHALGARLTYEGEEYHIYPTPAVLLQTGAEGLRALGSSRTKARYLLELAERAQAGLLDAASFDNLSDEDAIARLCEIPGIGRWTAEVALMFGLGRLDVFPAADVGLWNAAHRLLNTPTRPNERDLRALSDRWHPWRSYAALYLWTSLAGDHAT